MGCVLTIHAWHCCSYTRFRKLLIPGLTILLGKLGYCGGQCPIVHLIQPISLWVTCCCQAVLNPKCICQLLIQAVPKFPALVSGDDIRQSNNEE